jgi:hypothetical protein
MRSRVAVESSTSGAIITLGRIRPLSVRGAPPRVPGNGIMLQVFSNPTRLFLRIVSKGSSNDDADPRDLAVGVASDGTAHWRYDSSNPTEGRLFAFHEDDEAAVMTATLCHASSYGSGYDVELFNCRIDHATLKRALAESRNTGRRAPITLTNNNIDLVVEVARHVAHGNAGTLRKP